METNQLTMIDLLLETHVGLERQGPGSPEMTYKALEFLDDLDRVALTADLGCGSGGQTMILARHLTGTVVGLDLFPDFISVFNDNAQKQGLGERVMGVVGSMDDLPFEKESFDLIWSEGAIDNIGFEKGLAHWHRFLKKHGYVAVTRPGSRRSIPSSLKSFGPTPEAHWIRSGIILGLCKHAAISLSLRLRFRKHAGQTITLFHAKRRSKHFWKSIREMKTWRHLLRRTVMRLSCILSINSITDTSSILAKTETKRGKRGNTEHLACHAFLI